MSLVIIPHLYPKAGIDPSKDLAMVSNVGTVPMVLSVSNASGIKDLPDLLQRMKANPGKLNFGNGGAGTTAHLSEAIFLNMTKADAVLVQYRGSGPAIADLMAGTVDAVIDQTVTMMPIHAEKRVKSIAISTPQRIAQMPDVPTFAEGGVPQFDLMIWNGLVAPKGTPKATLDKLAIVGPTPAERGPQPMLKLVERDMAQVAEVVKAIGLKPE
jgi:tripartite-type tricarboxylate transporter receptor subunit TctC